MTAAQFIGLAILAGLTIPLVAMRISSRFRDWLAGDDFEPLQPWRYPGGEG